MITFLYISFVLLLILYSYKKTKSLYPIICIVGVTHGYLYQQLGVPHTEWINVCLIYLMFCFVVVSKKMKNDFKSYYFIILLYLLVASSLGSYGNFMHTAHWLKTYPLGFMLLYAIIHKPFKNHIFVEKLFLFLWLIQVAMIISWQFGINPLPNFRIEIGGGSLLDSAMGTWGFHVQLGDFMILGICYYLPDYLERRNKKTLVMLIAFFWILIQTHNRHLLPFVPLVLGMQSFMYYLKKGIIVKKSFRLLSIIIILCFGFMISAKYYFDIEKKLTFNVSVGETSRLVGDVSTDLIMFSSKILAYQNAYKYMADSNVLRIIMGYGPATFASGTAEGIGGTLYKVLVPFGIRTTAGGTSISDTVTNDFIGFGTEFGILGIIVLYSFFIYIMIFSYRKSKLLNNFEIELNRIIGIILYVMLIGTIRDFIPMGPFIIACILIGFNLNKLITYTTTIVDENDNKSILNQKVIVEVC